MKNSIVFTGIALISLVNVCNATNVVDRKQVFSPRAIDLNYIKGNPTVFEVIESVNVIKNEKTTEELLAEDNAITESNISNATYPLDFTIINSNWIADEMIESVNVIKNEKTTEELIAQDNAITENNISNETYALDFNIINCNSNLVIANN